MGWALLQKKLTPVPAEKLRKAFKRLPQLLDQDADCMARDAYGVLVEGLSHEDARTLQTALEGMDVGTKIVDEENLPDLPPARTINRAECRKDVFQFAHPEGTTYEMGWRSIIGIAAGAVRMEEWEHEREPDDRRHGVGMDPWRTRAPRWHTERTMKRECRPVVDVFSATREPRVRVMGDDFRYDYLGERMQSSSDRNFRLLVGDLVSSAETNFVNRGARDVVKNPDGELRQYPNMHAFNEEIVWLFYRRSLRSGS